jgi:hypothetical protein
LSIERCKESFERICQPVWSSDVRKFSPTLQQARPTPESPGIVDMVGNWSARFERLLKDPSQISVLDHTIGAPTKPLPDVMERINEHTTANHGMSSDALAKIIEATPGMYIGYGADQCAGWFNDAASCSCDRQRRWTNFLLNKPIKTLRWDRSKRLTPLELFEISWICIVQGGRSLWALLK